MRLHEAAPEEGRRAEVRATAAALFRRLGYHQTSMQQIADEVGILKGSLYHHYRSKAEMLFDICRDPLEQLVARSNAVAESHDSSATKISALIHTHIHALAESYPELMVVTAETDDSLPEGIRDEIARLRRAYQAVWRRVIAAGIEQHEISPELVPNVLTNFTLGAINWMTRWYDPRTGPPPEELANALTQVVLRGVLVDRSGVNG